MLVFVILTTVSQRLPADNSDLSLVCQAWNRWFVYWGVARAIIIIMEPLKQNFSWLYTANDIVEFTILTLQYFVGSHASLNMRSTTVAKIFLKLWQEFF